MLARLQTFTQLGIDAVPVDMDMDISTGALPSTRREGSRPRFLARLWHRHEQYGICMGEALGTVGADHHHAAFALVESHATG